jgi:hypothetical protein
MDLTCNFTRFSTWVWNFVSLPAEGRTLIEGVGSLPRIIIGPEEEEEEVMEGKKDKMRGVICCTVHQISLGLPNQRG